MKIYWSVNIGLINEMKIICDKMNLNIYEVSEMPKTKGFGFLHLSWTWSWWYCIPVDPLFAKLK